MCQYVRHQQLCHRMQAGEQTCFEVSIAACALSSSHSQQACSSVYKRTGSHAYNFQHTRSNTYATLG
jgi:hypothetical protein